MLNIENYFSIMQKHIKKAKSNLSIFMYTTNGVMIMLMTPFVYLHKKHFNKIAEYVNILNKYAVEENLDIKLENFYEIENSAVIYNQDQLGSLTVKQYESRIEYLNTLNHKVESLKKYI